MATFLRKIFLGDWNVKNPATLLDTVDATDKVDELELEYLVDVAISNPHNYRFSGTFKNGMSIVELFSDMTSELDATEFVTLSNGTKTVKRDVKEWKKVFQFELDYFIPSDKNPAQNILINVDGKNIKPEVVKISKLNK